MANIQGCSIEHEQIETTNGLAVKPTLNPRHRNPDLPSSQQWHPSERRQLLPSTALLRGIHLSSAGLEWANGTRELRPYSERSARVTPGHLSSGAYYLKSSKLTHLLYSMLLLFSCYDPYRVAARTSYSSDPFAAQQSV